MTEELESDIKFFSISQESVKRLPKVFVMTENNDIIFYNLKVNRTTAKNKLSYEMIARYEYNLMQMNPIDTWPENFVMSKREFVSFKAKESKNFIYFLIADSMGNIQ